MEEEKNDLLMAVEKLKKELRDYEISCSKQALDVTLKQNKALISSSQLNNIRWKITQADFILSHEKERHEKTFKTIEESKRNIKTQQSNRERETDEAKKTREMITVLEEEKYSLQKKLENLIKYNEDAKNSISNSKQITTILKKRNAALMIKLQKRLEEADKEEKKLSARFRNI